MNDGENERLARMEKTLLRIEIAVLGDTEAGHLGLVARMNNHASRLKSLERWRLYYVGYGAGAAAVLMVLYKLLTDWWPHK